MSGAQAGRGTRPVTICLCDDHADFRELLRAGLERDGIEVMGEAADGACAIELVERLRPEIALLDLAMPEVDGFAVIVELRRRAPTTRMIVLSSMVNDAVRQQVIGLGAQRCLRKGVSLAGVVAAIHEVAGR